MINLNGSYFSNPTFPQAGTNDNFITPPGNVNSTSILSLEQSLIENILRLNKGKKVKVYASYPDSNELRDRIYNGIIVERGRDHLILSDPSTGNWYLIRMLYVNFVEFAEKINYSPDYSDTFD